MLKGTHIVEALSGIQYASVIGCLFYLMAGHVFAELPVERQNEVVHMVEHDCGSCHGMTLNGGLGPPLTADRLSSRSPDELFDIIAYGIEGKPMPPWKEILSQEEISWLIKQLQSGSLIKK